MSWQPGQRNGICTREVSEVQGIYHDQSSTWVSPSISHLRRPCSLPRDQPGINFLIIRVLSLSRIKKAAPPWLQNSKQGLKNMSSFWQKTGLINFAAAHLRESLAFRLNLRPVRISTLKLQSGCTSLTAQSNRDRAMIDRFTTSS